MKNMNLAKPKFKVLPFLLVLLLFVQGSFLFAQTTVQVSGIIHDTMGLPLIGVSVKEVGRTNGQVTDVDGKFKLTTQSNGSLEFSYVGYTTKVIEINGKNDLGTIVLTEDTQILDEIVVVGYGTMQKKQVTSSVTSISSKDLVQGVGGSSVATALQGKIGGLVISGNASPNSSNTFQLRGVASVNSGQSPLIVVDGMPGGDIRAINQEDIESVDVLKDASAGAIYGTRAAGGVILITTKRAKDTGGKIHTTYTGELNFKQNYRKPRMLTAEEYVSYGRGKDYGSSADWYDEVLNNTPISQRHVLSLSGGSQNSKVYASLFYGEDKGLPINDARTDYGGRINTDFKLLDGWLDFGLRADYRQTKRIQGRPDFTQALRSNPTRSPYDPDSETGYNIWMNETLDYNVLADAKLKDEGGLDKWFKPEMVAKLNVLPITGLSYTQTVGYENRQWEKHKYVSMKSRVEVDKKRRGEAMLGFNKTEHINAEGYATYIKEFGKHAITGVAGYSYFERNAEKFEMTNYNFSIDGVGVWDMGEGSYLADGDAKMSSKKDISEKLFALFGRASYSFDDKYMGMATIRRESSSKFSNAHKWGTFWALSGGWRISAEDFMKDVTFLNDLKVRVAYGVTGNNGFSSEYSKVTYSSDARWPIDGGPWGMSYGKKNVPNPDLKWEEKSEWNFGLDFSFGDNRIYGKFDIYRRKVKDMLYEVNVPTPPYPAQTMYQNIGDLKNNGWEIEIGADIVKTKDWEYSSNINLSRVTTKMGKLGSSSYIASGGLPAPGNPGSALRVQENSKIGQFYMWKFAGFNDDGLFMIYNKDDEAVIAKDNLKQDYKRHLGNFNPSLIIGWNHTVRYKQWDFTMNLRSWIDFDVYNAIDMYFALPNDKQNTNLLKRAYTKNGHIKDEKILTDYFLQDGTFLKIDAIHLGYNLNLKKYTNNLFDKARIYLTINNVATFTKYKGVNPEVNITGIKDNGMEMMNFYPYTRGYTLGVQLSF